MASGGLASRPRAVALVRVRQRLHHRLPDECNGIVSAVVLVTMVAALVVAMAPATAAVTPNAAALATTALGFKSWAYSSSPSSSSSSWASLTPGRSRLGPQLATTTASASSSALGKGAAHQILKRLESGKKRMLLPRASAEGKASDALPLTSDVVVIGSGLGGLCCAALLASKGKQVTVLESHTEFGGAAHSWTRRSKDGGVYTFESGPSLFSGLSPESTEANRAAGRPANNPLRAVLDAVGEDCDWITYNTWGCVFPEAQFTARVGNVPWEGEGGMLDRYGGPNAHKEWKALMEYMAPLISVSQDLPVVTAALREDALAAVTLARYSPTILGMLRYGPKLGILQKPFAEIVKEVGVKDEFILNWLNMLSFLLQGTPSDALLGAVMAYMLGDWYKDDALLDFPKGGSGAIIDALIRAVRKNGGRVVGGAHVSEIIVDDAGRATGVRVKRTGGEETKVLAREAIVSNADVWKTAEMVPEKAKDRVAGWGAYEKDTTEFEQCESFMHLHLGIDAKGLPEDLWPQFAVVRDWGKPIESEGNVMIVAIPSLLDPSMAPEGKHVIHAYTAGNEPISLWKGVERGSPEYEQLKKERAEVLWKALERVIPDIRQRVEIEMVGTPLTHSRFLRRTNGTYGPLVRAGEGTLPGHTTPLKGLFVCGDSTFPGIGVPAVAAGGTICANTISSLPEHFGTLRAMGF